MNIRKYIFPYEFNGSPSIFVVQILIGILIKYGIGGSIADLVGHLVIFIGCLNATYYIFLGRKYNFITFCIFLLILFLGAQAVGDALVDQVLKPKTAKETANILPSENKSPDDYEARYHAGEVAYHKCLDQIASLTKWDKQMVQSLWGDGELTEVTQQHNEYFDKWKANGSPYYDQKVGNWEVAFMKWMTENNPTYCESTDQINFFITERKKVIDNGRSASGNYFLSDTSVQSRKADYDCSDFMTHDEAQSFFDENDPETDPYELDRDKDGIACETL